MLTATLFAIVLVSGTALAQGAPASGSPAAASGARPTAVEKRCMASRRRVERQNEAIVQADARTEKERTARASCTTKRACENLDRALKASEARKQRLAEQLAVFRAEAEKRCAVVPAQRVSATKTPAGGDDG